MMHEQLRNRLEQIGARYRALCQRRALTVCWALAALAVAALFAMHITGDPAARGVGLIVIAVTGFVIFLVWLATSRIGRDVRRTARRIESHYRELDGRLLAAIEQVMRLQGTERPGYLQEQVIAQTLEHDRANDWRHVAPASHVAATRTLHAVTLACFAALLTLLWITPLPQRDTASDALAQSVRHDPDASFHVTVEPGDTTVERGTPLLIMARFDGRVPATATLVATDAQEGKVGRLELKRSLEDPLFGGRIASVDADLTYHVEYADRTTDTYTVTVFDFPQLLRADAQLAYPDYTGLKTQVLEDTHHISAVEGTQATWTFHLNKPVTEAKLVDDHGDVTQLTPDSTDPTRLTTTLTLGASRQYRLHLTDNAGRANKNPPRIALDVFANRRPTIKLVFPKRDVEVSPLEQLYVQGTVFDDFGLKAYGITYAIAGEKPVHVTLGEDAAGGGEHPAHQMIALESLNAQPDQLLSYHLWADDMGPGGQVRRTFSDMYFAEVRPFEEIFREGQAPPAGQQQQQQQQQGNMQQIDELVKGQKQIIVATWNLIRRETLSQVTETFAEDATLLRDSQAAAIEQLDALREKTQDAESLEIIDETEAFMQRALAELTQVAEQVAPGRLESALGPEQAAYQSLLRLRAREHEVIRSQQQQQQGGQQRAGAQRRQQQLEQLKLDNQDNRYQQQSAAQQQQQDPAQREVKQVLNRLRELARRQEDLNQKVKELEAALRQAQDEQERAEIERRLKRLREEQRQMLRDVDEVKNRMEQPANQEQMADARQQVEQSRQNVRRASEALEEGMLDKAMTEGARAERQLQQLRDQFREKASGQFDETMRDMRNQAQQLAERQQDLADRLKASNDDSRKTLRDDGDRQQIVEGLRQQRQQADQLLDRVRRVTEEAEQSEPLLSRKLYDTWRDAQQQQIDKALDVSSQLLDRGFTGEAQQVEQQARQGINDLRKGVEQAADSVLGDQGEALRRARDQVEQLSRELDSEIARNTPNRPNTDGTTSPQSQGQPADSQQAEPGQSPSQRSANVEQQQDNPASAQQQSGQANGQRQEQSQTPQQATAQQPGQESAQPSGQQSSQQGQPQNPQGSAQRQGQQPGQTQASQDQQQGQASGQAQANQGPSPGLAQQQASSQQQTSQQRSSQQDGQQSARANARSQSPRFFDQPSGLGGSGAHAPITGENFRDWSDRLRDVEEMLDSPELREEVARVRDRARAARAEFKRHSKTPNWDLVQQSIAEPLNQLRQRIDEELAKHQDDDTLVPIDRDPVPRRFADQVRRYYERLGAGD